MTHQSTEPLRVFRRLFCLSHAASAVCFRWRWYTASASASAGGRFPTVSRIRRWLNQWTHSSVVNFTGSRPRQGPRSRITSVLYSPMMDSARASYESPTLPTDCSMPAWARQALGVVACPSSPPRRAAAAHAPHPDGRDTEAYGQSGLLDLLSAHSAQDIANRGPEHLTLQVG